MTNNKDLQKDVEDALQWEPLLKATKIGVTVSGGIVTLTGTVNNYSKKLEAEEVVKYVAGVLKVIENIEVRFDSVHARTDGEIAVEIVNAFKWHWDIPNEQISITVEDGWVSLAGEIGWNYQKEAAKSAVVNLIGVKGVSNNILIIPKSKRNL